MTKKLTIVFFGSGPVAAESLNFLSDQFTVEAVITKATPPHHKGKAPVDEIANDKNLTLMFANSKEELDQLVEKAKFESSLGIIVDHGVIVSEKTIKSFRLGIVNSHFSLLPQWRGADPITFSILSGQAKTGVSLMVIEPPLDTGKIIVQRSLGIDKTDTSISLTSKLIELSNKLLLDYLPLYFDGTVEPRSQSHPERATYSRKLTKSDGEIDWKKPAEVIEREIRAFIGWPRSRTKLGEVETIITQAEVIDKNGKPGSYIIKDNKLIVHCGMGALRIKRLQPAGKREMTDSEFLRGYKNKL